jgi:hypothetical protein
MRPRLLLIGCVLSIACDDPKSELLERTPNGGSGGTSSTSGGSGGSGVATGGRVSQGGSQTNGGTSGGSGGSGGTVIGAAGEAAGGAVDEPGGSPGTDGGADNTDEGGAAGAQSGGSPATGGKSGTGGSPTGTGGSGEGGAAEPEGTPIAVAVGDGRSIYSKDGENWTLQTLDTMGASTEFRGVNWGNGRFILVGGAGTGMSMISTNGVDWEMGGEADDFISDACWIGNVWVAAGGNGLRVRSTDNGASWTGNAGGQSRHYRSGACGNGLFVAVGHSFAATPEEEVGIIATTPDGITWTDRRAEGPTFGTVIFGNGVFVASGAASTVVTSSDGVEWTDQVVGTGNGNVIFTGSEFVLMRGSGIYTSSDGSDWTLANAEPKSVAGFINGSYVALLSPLRVETSPDLINWDPVLTPMGGGMIEMAVGYLPQ